MGFPDSSVGKESACNAGDPGSILGSGRSTGKGLGYPFQYSWVSLVAQLVKNLPTMQGPGFKYPLEEGREWLPIPVFWPGEFHGLCSPSGHKELNMTGRLSLFRASQLVLVVKNPSANAGDPRDMSLIPGSGRSPGGGHGNLLQYSCLENLLDRGAWQAIVHVVVKSQT